jgi:two-component system response regulator NreC
MLQIYKWEINMKIKILVADDNHHFRRRVSTFLATESDFEVIDEIDDGSKVVSHAVRLKPDVILMDVSMPGMNGLDATKQVTGVMPGVKVIMLSVYDIDEYKKASLEHGAVGYVVKKEMATQLVPMIREVLKN